MEVRYLADPIRFTMMDTEEVRENMLLDSLFQKDEIYMAYIDVDRAVAGSAVPQKAALTLAAADELRAKSFCERRELGVLNIGGSGKVTVDGTAYEMDSLDCLYVGMGSEKIVFEQSDDAVYYLLSYPAHQAFPTTLVKKSEATPVELGTMEESNARTIFKYIHPQGAKSCQLVMGITQLKAGCVWNTMPPHTHERRMEVYLYFAMDEDAVVFHLCGDPQETRHIVVQNEQAVASPSWSIHSGVGTKNYTFCWGMGGENQAFDDMDFVAATELR